MRFSPARLGDILGAFQKNRILVVGDVMLDEFLWGKVTRISPEAPVPVVEVQRRAAFPGGAANVARNLASLGARVSIAGVRGDDEPGRQLVDLLEREGIATGNLRATPLRPTTHKTRVCAITRQLHDHLDIEDQQQIVRVDDESRAPLDEESQQWLFGRLKEEIRHHNAVIIEDYAKGLITQELVSLVIGEANTQGKIVAIDPNPNNPCKWSGATVLKPNRREAFLAAGLPYDQNEESILNAASILQKRHAILYLLITLGEAGMLLLEQGGKPYRTPTRAQDVFDVSGAGDTAIAAFTLALAAGANGVESAEIANHAAGVVVGKLGTATLTTEELREMFSKSGGSA
ncbi:MAG TPA: D-glycero-beta-D-manno-heptose-7-phosphate kinase [Candidatus Methylacidiphilales bacterium]|nr:D-glycero-beta-D-manno-heptose-7-phosphate kinase [Candidatus Methylacidiphilales bacterium]